MSENRNPARVVALVDPGQTQEQIRAALNSGQEMELVVELHGMDAAAQRVSSAMPDIILVDQQLAGQSTLDLVDELATKFPDAALLAFLEDDGGAQVQRYLLAGARSFLVKPFTQASLLRVMRRILELEVRRREVLSSSNGRAQMTPDPLQTVTVYSPRGGVGCSTIAVNLAVALHERFDLRVLLMEGKMMFGHLGLMLNSRPRNTIADLIPHAGALDEALVEEVVSQHASGIHMLLGSPDLNVGQGIRPNDLHSVIEALRRTFDLIVIDAGSHLDDNAVTLMDMADRVLLVTTPDLAALHDTSRFIQLARGLGFPPNKVLTVLNRAGLRGGIKPREIEGALRQPLFGQVSEGDAKVIRSLNRGIPLLYGASHSTVSKDIRLLAASLGSMRRDVVVQHVPKGSLRLSLQRDGDGKLAHSRGQAVALKAVER